MFFRFLFIVPLSSLLLLPINFFSLSFLLWSFLRALILSWPSQSCAKLLRCCWLCPLKSRASLLSCRKKTVSGSGTLQYSFLLHTQAVDSPNRFHFFLRAPFVTFSSDDEFKKFTSCCEQHLSCLELAHRRKVDHFSQGAKSVDPC